MNPDAITTLDNIERIALADAPSFHAADVARSRPVVITDFLDAEAVARVRAVGQASGQPARPGAIAPARLFDEQTLLDALDEAGTETVFTRAPDDVLAFLGARLGLSSERDTVSEMWAGRAGGETLFHYDLDMRANVLVQLFGHKRVAIADPDQTQKLEPLLHGDRPQFSSRYLAAHGADDRRRFLAFIEAGETVLGPGEALFIPALYWHQLEYLDTTLSITVRLGRDPWIEWLAGTVGRLWPAEVALVQGIAARCIGDDAPRPRLAELRAAFEAACESAEHDPHFLDTLHGLHAELCPGRFSGPLSERDAPYFKRRRGRRPPATPSSSWDATSIPWLAPGYEVLELIDDTRDTADFRVLGCANAVVAQLSVPPDAGDLIRELLGLLAHRGSDTIADLAETVGLDDDQLVELISGWAERGWIVSGPASPAP